MDVLGQPGLFYSLSFAIIALLLYIWWPTIALETYLGSPASSPDR